MTSITTGGERSYRMTNQWSSIQITPRSRSENARTSNMNTATSKQAISKTAARQRATVKKIKVKNLLSRNPYGFMVKATTWLNQQIKADESKVGKREERYTPRNFENTENEIEENDLLKARDEYWRRVRELGSREAKVHPVLVGTLRSRFMKSFIKMRQTAQGICTSPRW